MRVGYVKWFNATKGYGFLTANDLPDDVFVHYSAIVMSGYRTLQENARVSFELVSNPNNQRLMAALVTPIDPTGEGADVELSESSGHAHQCGV
jgi:cold shock protein